MEKQKEMHLSIFFGKILKPKAQSFISVLQEGIGHINDFNVGL